MKTKKYTAFIFILFIFVVLGAPFALHAQNNGLNQDIYIKNPFTGGDSLLALITAILNNIILPIATVAAVMYVIFAGFKYVQAKGNPAEIQKAHQRLLWTLIGVGVLLGAAGISAVLQTTVNSFLK